MALKRKIDKAAFDKLSAEIKAEYVEKDGDYVLDVDGDDGGEDVGALRRAKDREVQARKDAEAKARDAEAKLAEIDTETARKGGDIATLEKSWQKKLDDQKAESDAALAKKDTFISSQLVDNVATQIAGEISTTPALILPHIKARLTADMTGDTPATQYLGKDGKPTTADAFKKEFVDNPDFKSIIRASKASGGGAPDKGRTTQLGGAMQNNGDKAAPLASIPAKDLAAAITARKEANAE